MHFDNDVSQFFDELEIDAASSGYHPRSPHEQDDRGYDDVMEYALRAVGLWGDLVVSGGAGFESPLREEALSRGQRQMFGLARAIIRARLRLLRREAETGDDANGSSVPPGAGAGGMLLLDEYNAGLDADTDRAMWAIISREFQGHTIICVAHRLLSITKCYEKVIVMGDGRVIEIGSPDELLSQKNSKLREPWEVEQTQDKTTGQS
jgi:ATP-binding cassette, subfamily C (CFTR/MRP), member 1